MLGGCLGQSLLYPISDFLKIILGLFLNLQNTRLMVVSTVSVRMRGLNARLVGTDMSMKTADTDLKRALWLSDLELLCYEVWALKEPVELRREKLKRVLERIPAEALEVQ